LCQYRFETRYYNKNGVEEGEREVQAMIEIGSGAAVSEVDGRGGAIAPLTNYVDRVTTRPAQSGTT